MVFFHLGEVETLPQFHLRALYIRSELNLFQDQTGQINNLIGRYIMELSQLKYIQRYMTPSLGYNKNTQMRWQRRDVKISNKCPEVTFSLAGEDGAESVEGVELFKYFGQPMDRSDDKFPEVLSNIR